MSKKNLEAIIETIEMTEDQQKAFDTYIGEFLSDWQGKLEKKVYEEVTDTLTREYNTKAKKFEGRLRKTLSEEIGEDLKEKIGAELKEQHKTDIEKEVKEAVDVLNEYYHGRFELFCQETVSEVEKTMLEQQEGSPEVAAFRQVINNVSPFVVESGDKSKLIETLELQDKTIRNLQSKLEEVTKEKMVSECVALLPESMKGNMKKFLDESCETAEEVIDKFEHAVEFIKESDELIDDDQTVEDDIDEDGLFEDDEDEDDELLEDEEDEEDEELEEDEEDLFEDENDDDDKFEDEINEDKVEKKKSDKIEEDELFEDKIITESPIDEGDQEDERATVSPTKQRMLDLAGMNEAS